MDNHEEIVPPHVHIFPLPLQGPVNCTRKLAELLCISGLRVTFLNTDHIHARLLKNSDVRSRFYYLRNFSFQTISDGLPEDHPRSGDQSLLEVVDSMEVVTKSLLKEMLVSDGFLSFPLGVAAELGIPLLFFDTISPCALWTYLCLPKLIDVGEIPFKGNDLDVKITSVSGMENFLRRRDLPSFCRTSDLNDHIIQLVLKEVQQLPLAHGLILNTSEEIDESVLCQMKTTCSNIYPIGPLQALHKSILSEATTSPSVISSNSLWEEDRSCMTWLDPQPRKSVIYISIGSLAVMTMDQLMEFWDGLVNSGKRFLWVRRLGSIVGGDENFVIPAEISEATKERGCIVSWVPQEEVLAHPAVGAFLTHSGWNSTLESIVEGVPMICWPYFVDQQVNSRFVDEVWRIGIDMIDSCDRSILEKMVRDVMDDGKDEFEKSASTMATLATQSVCKGGSSYNSLERLV